MNQHSRKTSGIALVATLALGFGALAATGQFKGNSGGAASIDQLERAISSGHGDVATWAAYAEALQGQNRFDHAAQAYQRALEMQPDPSVVQNLRLNGGICLAKAGDSNKFFDFVTHLTTTDPKQAVDLLDRAELMPMHSDSRWAPAMTTARAQAAD